MLRYPDISGISPILCHIKKKETGGVEFVRLLFGIIGLYVYKYSKITLSERLSLAILTKEQIFPIHYSNSILSILLSIVIITWHIVYVLVYYLSPPREYKFRGSRPFICSLLFCITWAEYLFHGLMHLR